MKIMEGVQERAGGEQRLNMGISGISTAQAGQNNCKTIERGRERERESRDGILVVNQSFRYKLSPSEGQREPGPFVVPAYTTTAHRVRYVSRTS